MKTVPLGDLVERVATHDPSRSASRTFTYVDLSSVDRELKRIASPEVLSSDDAPSRARQLVAEGDVLVSTVRPNLNAVATVPQHLHGATASTGFCVLRPRPTMLDPRYLAHWVRTSRFVDAMARSATGASYPAVSDRIVKASEIPLPPIEEQRRIAAVLDAADALRAKRRHALAKLDTLTQSIFIDMFGDPVRNERRWRSTSIGEISTVQIGPFGSLLHQSDYVVGGVPLVNPTHIVDGDIRPDLHQTVGPEKYDRLETYWMRPRDVVMGRRGEMGRVAIVNEDQDGYLCGSGSLFLRLDANQATAEYVAAALAGRRGRAQLERAAQGVTMLNLNSTIVEEFALGVPPLDLQNEFLARRRYAEVNRDNFERSFRHLDTLFASLQQRAFRGEL